MWRCLDNHGDSHNTHTLVVLNRETERETERGRGREKER